MVNLSSSEHTSSGDFWLLKSTRIMIYKGMFYKSKYWILEKI